MGDRIIDNKMFSTSEEAIIYDNVNRIIAYLLDAWCSFTGPRKKWYGDDIRGALPIIEFEKLAIFISRIWNKLHKIKSDKEIGISFNFPYEEMPGKHGYSLAKSNWKHNGEPGYLSDILIEQQKNKLSLCIRFDIPKEKKDFYKTRVSAAIKIPREDILFDTLNEFEKEVLRDLHNSIKRLGVNQIRALGTHDSRERALKDVRYEAVKWKSIVNPVLTLLKMQYDDNKASLLEDKAQEMLEYADEAWRKSSHNCNDYEDAMKIMLQEITHKLLKDAFNRCQKTKDDIWKHEEMHNLAHDASIALAISKYIRGISYFRRRPEDMNKTNRRAKKYLYQINEGINMLKELQLESLPPGSNVFESGNREVKSEILLKINNTVHECKTFMRMKENL